MATQSSLFVTEQVSVPLSEIEFSAIRASGPGGQSVNKTSTAIELRFSVARSSLSEQVKSRLFAISDRRLNALGIIVIKSGAHKSQKRNKDEALDRLKHMILKATYVPKARKKTRPTRSSVKKRLDKKSKRSAIKVSRRKVQSGDE